MATDQTRYDHRKPGGRLEGFTDEAVDSFEERALADETPRISSELITHMETRLKVSQEMHARARVPVGLDAAFLYVMGKAQLSILETELSYYKAVAALQRAAEVEGETA